MILVPSTFVRMELLPQFLSTFPSPPKRVVVAVSGGLDSVVLTDLCARAGLQGTLLHVNFRLRGTESNRDQQFVQQLAHQYQLPFLTTQFDTEVYATAQKLSIQEAARNLRYQWFREKKEELKADWILTAHHADDNIETLLFNFLRGTGLKGLTGMPIRNGDIFRPMLAFRRQQILDYATERKLQWVEDSSNESLKYSRNFIRHEVLPKLQEAFPEVKENLLNSIARFQAIYHSYQSLTAAALKGIVQIHKGETRIPILRLLKLPEALWYELLQPYGFGEKQYHDIRQLCHSTNGKWIASTSHRMIRHGQWLLLVPPETSASIYTIESEKDKLTFEEGNLNIERLTAPVEIPFANDQACLDLKQIVFPLVLRRWKSGDYFYPLGMKKKKKVARFLIDRKTSKLEKEKTWVLESDKRILWVVGLRIDERFKLTPSTREVLKITYQRQ